MASKAAKTKLSKQAMPAPIARQQSDAGLRQKLGLFLAAVAIIVFANTMQNGFVYDDQSAITKNTIVVRGIAGIPELLTTPYRHGYWVVPNDTYRPLSLVLFAIEYQVLGKNAATGHLVNVILYAACVFLLFLFLDDLFQRKKTAIAFIAALLFAVYPIHTEVVANIKSSDELLSFLFAMLALATFDRYTSSGAGRHLALGAFYFLLSLLSKETGISFIAIILLVFLLYRNEDRQRSYRIAGGALLSVIVFFTIRSAVLNAYHIDQFANIPLLDNGLVMPGLPVASRIASAVLILGYYIRLLFVPWPLIVDYSYDHIPFTSFANPLVLLSLTGYVFIAVASIRRLIAHPKDPYAFCGIWFLVTISLYSNTFMLIAATLGERFLFFPSVALCLLLALLAGRWLTDQNATTTWAALRSPKLLAAVIPLCLLFAGLSISRNTDWADNLTLYSADIKKAPRSVKLNYLLGMELLNGAKEETNAAKQQQEMNEGIGYLSRALAIYPDYDDAQSELGGAYFRAGRLDSAEAHGRISLRLNPRNPYTLNNMGGIAFERKDYRTTIELCEKAIAIQPGIVDVYTNVAASFLSLGKFDSGISYLYKAITVDPTYTTSYRFMATAYRNAGKQDSAAKYEALAKKSQNGM